MKRFILSLISLIFGAVMAVSIICPIASFKTTTKEGETILEYAQNATMLNFVESCFVNDEKVDEALADYLVKTGEVTADAISGKIKLEDSPSILRGSTECATYEVYKLASDETMVYFSMASDDKNLNTQTKAVGWLSIVFLAFVGLVALVNLFGLFINSSKLRAFGTFLTLVAFLLSVSIALVIEFALTLSAGTLIFVSTAKWALYVMIGYSFIYFVLRLILNRNLKNI